MSKNLSEELTWRGFANQTTYSDITVLDKEPITFYWGVDPSAPSMTIGNLAAAMMVKHFINAGHKAVLLVGGATGLIGDPDGKSTERELKTLEQIKSYKQGISNQYQQLFGKESFEIVDNYDWFKDINYLRFLRDVGKHVPVRQMIGRDFVQSRLGEGGAGISYAEFSYVLIQAYDFVHLNKEHNVTLQLCGADQWGNSIAGVDLVRRMNGKESHVWSTPLVINKSTGKKFGKTEEGAIWLDPEMTSIFAFYQFWLNLDDEGVEEYLKIYTMLEEAEIIQIMQDFKQNPGQRLAQKRLAQEATTLVHGVKNMEQVQRMTNAFFGGVAFTDLSEEEKLLLSKEFPAVKASDDVAQILVDTGLASSKSEARTFLTSGAISINDNKTDGTEIEWQQGNNLIKRGKNKFAIVQN